MKELLGTQGSPFCFFHISLCFGADRTRVFCPFPKTSLNIAIMAVKP